MLFLCPDMQERLSAADFCIVEGRSRLYILVKMRMTGGFRMKDKIFGVLQRIGRSFMLPIAILPVAGLLLGFGSSFTNATTIQTYGLEKILKNSKVTIVIL